MALVQIGRPVIQAPAKPRIAPAADNFFSLGILAAIVGTCLLGTYLWLARTGQVRLPGNYLALRSAHAYLQLYGFIGSFIIAFLLQAGRMVFGVQVAPRSGTKFVFFVFALGIVLTTFVNSNFGPALLSLCFLSTIWLLGPLLRSAPAQVQRSVGAPCVAGLVGFAISALGPVDTATYSIVAFWSSVVPVAMSVAQQIMRNLFNTKMLSGISLLAVYGCWIISVGLGWSCIMRTSDSGEWILFAAAVVTTTFLFVALTGAYRTILARDEYAIGFVLAWSWLMLGALGLLYGPGYADYALHLWGAGFAMTLILNVSTRVVGSITNSTVFPGKVFQALILLWQLVPLGRGFGGISPTLHASSWITTFVALVVVVGWASGLAYAVGRHIRLSALSGHTAKGSL